MKNAPIFLGLVEFSGSPPLLLREWLVFFMQELKISTVTV